MKTLKKVAAFIAVFAFMAMVNQVSAQSTTVTASGTVVKPISLSGTGISFGSEIFPGSPKTVDKTATGAAQFDISGEPGKAVNTTFTLPSEVSDGSGNTIPLSFSSTDAGYASATTDQSTGQTGFDPSVGQSLTLEATSGELYIWLGGTITPTNTQPAGTYSANITLDVSYPTN